jgi:hypothetical protein
MWIAPDQIMAANSALGRSATRMSAAISIRIPRGEVAIGSAATAALCIVCVCACGLGGRVSNL